MKHVVIKREDETIKRVGCDRAAHTATLRIKDELQRMIRAMTVEESTTNVDPTSTQLETHSLPSAVPLKDTNGIKRILRS